MKLVLLVLVCCAICVSLRLSEWPNSSRWLGLGGREGRRTHEGHWAPDGGILVVRLDDRQSQRGDPLHGLPTYLRYQLGTARQPLLRADERQPLSPTRASQDTHREKDLTPPPRSSRGGATGGGRFSLFLSPRLHDCTKSDLSKYQFGMRTVSRSTKMPLSTRERRRCKKERGGDRTCDQALPLQTKFSSQDSNNFSVASSLFITACLVSVS